MTLTWSTENSLITAGHDCQPIVFSGSQDGWQVVGSLDDTSSAAKSPDGGRPGLGSSSVGRLKTGAFATFRDADTRGQSTIGGAGSSTTETKLLTVHQNTITSIRPYEIHSGQVTKVSTTGVDGSLVIWDTTEVATSGIAALAGRLGTTQLR